MEQQAVAAPPVPANVVQEEAPAAPGDGMDVDVPAASAQPQGKRKASEEFEVDGNVSKKVRMGTISSYRFACISVDCRRLEAPTVPLKRYVLCMRCEF